MGKCYKCGKENEIRRLTQGLCAMCSKGKAKTVINAPTSNFLDATTLNKPAQRQEIGPDDSLSMIGFKRQS
jgi:hypothetical protein